MLKVFMLKKNNIFFSKTMKICISFINSQFSDVAYQTYIILFCFFTVSNLLVKRIYFCSSFKVMFVLRPLQDLTNYVYNFLLWVFTTCCRLLITWCSSVLLLLTTWQDKPRPSTVVIPWCNCDVDKNMTGLATPIDSVFTIVWLWRS